MTTPTYKIGQRIQVIISYSGEIFDGIIISIGEHKGRKVYDLDCNRFVYESQILGAY
jgi:hypothetical protein